MWNAVKAGDDGSLDTQKIRGGYAFATFDSPTERIMLLEAAGHAMVYVNGEPHTGDPYSVDWLRLPVLIKKGKNTLLFHLSADKLKARLAAAPEKPVFIDAKDHTLPTLVDGRHKTGLGLGSRPRHQRHPRLDQRRQDRMRPEGRRGAPHAHRPAPASLRPQGRLPSSHSARRRVEQTTVSSISD